MSWRVTNISTFITCVAGGLGWAALFVGLMLLLAIALQPKDVEHPADEQFDVDSTYWNDVAPGDYIVIVDPATKDTVGPR